MNSTSFLILLGIVLYAGVFLLPFSFASNDDSLMMGLLDGSYTGEPEGYVVFLHPILSEGTSFLYRLYNDFPWYPVLWFLFSFLSYVAFVLAVGTRRYTWSHQLMWIVLYLLFSLQQLFLLQFTVVAGISAFSGYMLLFEAQRFPYKRLVGKETFASFLIIVSILVRTEAFFLVTIGCGSFLLLKYGLFHCIALLRKNVGLLLIGMALIGYVPIYEKKFGYEEYATFTRTRSKVIDHPVFWYITPQIDKEARPDLFFFRNWLFEDNPAVNISFLEQTKGQLDGGYFSPGYFLYSLQRIMDFHKHHNFALFTTFCYIFLLVLIDSPKRENLKFCFLWVAFFLVFNHFFLVPHRVQSLFELTILGAAWLCRRKIALQPNVLLLTVSIILGLFIVHVLRITQALNSKEKIISEVEFITELIPRQTVSFTDLIGIKHLDPRIPSHEESRYIYFGWHSRSPMQAKALERFGYGELREIKVFYYLTMRNNKLVIPEYLSYLKREEFKREFVASTGDFLLFKYSK